MKKRRYKFKKPKSVPFTEKKPFLADKEIIFRSGGRAKVFNISHRLQVFALMFAAAVFAWSGYNYYYYHSSARIIHSKEKELGKTRDAYMDLMSDVSALQNNLRDVMDSVEDAGKGLKEIDSYKEKALAVEDKIKKITDSETWIDSDKVKDDVSKKEALLQKDIALQENDALRQKIVFLDGRLEGLRQTVRGLENAEIAILEKMEKLSGREIEDIKTSLTQINKSLKVQKQYFNPLSNAGNGKGGTYYTPGNGALLNKKLQDKISSVFGQIELLESYKAEMAKVPLGSPVYNYRLSSSFGGRSDPFNQRLAHHKGLDMSAALGTRVSAPAEGTVVSAGYRSNGYGNLVEIKHRNGFMTRYAHLNKIYVKKGDKVKYNTAIGEVGRTGRATGSHLHYEVLYNGRNVNPLTFVNTGSMNKL